MVGHCREILRLGTSSSSGIPIDWALQDAAGIVGGCALQGCLVVGH